MQTYRFEVRVGEEAALDDNRAAWEYALRFVKRLPDLEGRLRVSDAAGVDIIELPLDTLRRLNGDALSPSAETSVDEDAPE
jgi:hypothetical protein